MSDTAAKLNLSGMLGELARRGYKEEALILGSGEWGGTKRYIPRTASGSLLEGMIGLQATEFLVKKYGGVEHDIPRVYCEDDVKAKILAHTGSTRDCAIALGCTERWVREVRRQGGVKPIPRRNRNVDERQINMFDEAS